jgi:DNA polymerase-3 subunit gamma/tau
MTYLALARKWRPRTFDDVVGQSHVVRALSNALNTGRVHHAFLFAGTRGVGKTTIARILARCLNCEKGVSATPCGSCRACVAIEEGRFVDLIEVDAASRTGVDDTRELLDNVQYTPSAGRFKVYLIDEVHMLSKQSFNALLKTLEEPPPHVKFLLATTDAQKVPVTVLSRCLQFNLKRLPTGLIVEQMTRICRDEGVNFEPAAFERLARAAAGSMRDGLSLLDQALAYGGRDLREQDVSAMLGSLDRGRVIALLDALAKGDAAGLMGSIRELDELVPDYAGLLDDMARAFQRIAVIQLAGAGALEDEDDLQGLARLAKTFDPDATQLHYQIAVTGRRDLPLAPDPRLGFEMAMLRMLAFQPSRTPATATPDLVAAENPASEHGGRRTTASGVPRLDTAADWMAFVPALDLEGAARELARHTGFVHRTPFELRLGIDRSNSHMMTEQLRNRLVGAIQARLGEKLNVRFDVRDRTEDTPAAHNERSTNQAQQQARRAIESDPNVRDLTELLGAELVPDSVKPMTSEPGEAT